jgi:hypothetical protein
MPKARSLSLESIVDVLQIRGVEMTRDQLERLALKSQQFDKAARALRRILVETLPVGSTVRINTRAGLYARVTGHATDAPMVHAESTFGPHRLYAADILAASQGGDA